MIRLECEQYSDEWWKARLGIPSASVFSKIVTSQGKKSTSSKPLAFKLAAEKKMGKAEETFKSDAMQRGTGLEEEAREAYEFIKDIEVQEVGLIYQDEKKLWSCSPDGLLENKGLEIKCPLPGTHMQYLYENKLPTKYEPQVYGSLWICDECESWDFMSYHPELPPFITTVTREDKGYQIYSEALEKYLPEFVELVQEITGQ